MKHVLGRFTRKALKYAPQSIVNDIQQSSMNYSNVMAKKTLVPVMDQKWIEFAPEQDDKEHLAVEDLHNCVCIHFHATDPEKKKIKAGLVHFNTLDNSAEALEEAIEKAASLREQGYNVGTRLIINADSASNMTGSVDHTMQQVAQEHVHTMLDKENFPRRTIIIGEDNIAIPSLKTPPETAKDLVAKSFVMDFLSEISPQHEPFLVDGITRTNSQQGGFGRE